MLFGDDLFMSLLYSLYGPFFLYPRDVASSKICDSFSFHFDSIVLNKVEFNLNYVCLISIMAINLS
jgi:hypothetical protein